MKTPGVILLLSAFLAAMGGCGRADKEKDRTAASSLFMHTVKLADRYAVKIGNAPDSARLAELSREFEDSLEHLNFSYPPDTDLLLTEGQNDTIYRCVQKIVEARKRRLGQLQPHPEPLDSLPNDSVVSASLLTELE